MRATSIVAQYADTSTATGTSYSDSYAVSEFDTLRLVGNASDIGSSGTATLSLEVAATSSGPWGGVGSGFTLSAADTPGTEAVTNTCARFARVKRVVATDTVSFQYDLIGQ